MLTNKAKKQILMSVLETVEHVSNKEYQKRVCNFFGDGDPLLENYKEFGLTESQYLSLKKFRDSFRDFSDKYYHPYEFIDTPEWNEITEMAKEVLKAFHYKE